ncbi:MAG: DNA-binding protein [Candidatus Heimdallarchaeota archaeon]|nr:DNA-binding protein [Candidatus Heimdallarchaeota archaeon]
MSDELEELRKKRMQELQEQQISQQDAARIQQEQERAAALEEQKQLILRQILTDDAKQRLSNLKLVKQQMATAIENQLIQLYQAGRIGSPINEEQFLQMLKQLQGSKRESSIKFKRV